MSEKIEKKEEFKFNQGVSEKDTLSFLNATQKHELFLKVFKKDNNTCRCCSFSLMDNSNIFKELDLHIFELNKENVLESEFLTLCKACHVIQHIDVAIKNGWVSMVNSVYTQGQLIHMCRINSIIDSIEKGTTRYLKKSPSVFLEEIDGKDFSISESKVKFILTNKFWETFS